MQRNPFFTKDRAIFYFKKIEYFYNNHAYEQALLEIEKNKDLLGAVLNVGNQLSLNKIYTNSIVNFMLDLFEADGNTELFDKSFIKYKTILELHAKTEEYSKLKSYYTEKDKNRAFSSRNDRLSIVVADTIGEYEDASAKLSSKPKQKDDRSLSIEEDFLNSIGHPQIVSSDLKEAVRAEEKKIYGSKDDFDDTTIYNTIPANKRIRPPKKTEPSQKDKDIKNPYSQTQSVSEGGGRVTELEFLHSKKENKAAANRPAPKQVLKKTKKSPSPKAPTKAPNKSRKKKKKKSSLPLIIFMLLVLVISGSIFAGFTTGFFDSIINSINTSIQKSSTEKDPSQAETEIPKAPEKNPLEYENQNPDSDPALDPDSESESESDSQYDSEYILQSDVKYIDEEDLSGMDKDKIRLVINEMYARKGWHFDFGGQYYDYFMEKSWYKPDKTLSSPSQAASSFSDIENINLATIVKYRDKLRS